MITRTTWYMNPEITYNIVSQCRDREIAFISKQEKVYAVRNVMANYIGLLIKNYKAFHFHERPYNLYYSLARYKRLKIFSFAPTIRKEQRSEWNASAVENTDTWDLGLDFDSDGLHDWKRAWTDAKKVKDLLDKHRVSYSIKFSGGKGFHILIPHTELPPRRISSDVEDDEGLINWCKRFAELLDLKLSIPTLDRGIFDPRRIWKCDYSWTCETGLIVLPLTDSQFDNFDLSMVEPMNVLKAGVRNRFDLMRRGEKGAFKKLVEDELDVVF